MTSSEKFHALKIFIKLNISLNAFWLILDRKLKDKIFPQKINFKTS